MKKNPGRKERRRLYFNRRRQEGQFRAAMHNYFMSHQHLKKFREFKEKADAAARKAAEK